MKSSIENKLEFFRVISRRKAKAKAIWWDPLEWWSL
jgi:hypothetical protein